MKRFDKTLPGSSVKVWTPEIIKKEMAKLQDLRREAGLPYWSQERIYQELFDRKFGDLLESMSNAVAELNSLTN